MSVILPAILMGVVAGMRAMTAPAAVSWAAALGWIAIGTTALGFLARPITPWVFTLLALAEFVTDQLPRTGAARAVAVRRAAGLGALSGGAIGLQEAGRSAARSPGCWAPCLARSAAAGSAAALP